MQKDTPSRGNKMKIFLMSSVILSSLMINGCITRHTVIPMQGQNQQQQATDKEACLKMATSDDGLDFDIWHECLKSKGYRIDSTPFNISF